MALFLSISYSAFAASNPFKMGISISKKTRRYAGSYADKNCSPFAKTSSAISCPLSSEKRAQYSRILSVSSV